ncbi:MAG TPA: toast rack family protein [Candidatus Angelobacter sp.]|jgi:hypothetical protein|nr:toast rack family protein [Candidatus Angelobacter sp.]
MGRVYRRSITGALVLIALGVIFLYSNLRPGFDPWSVLSRYWPLLLIFWGLGRIFDYFMFERENVNGVNVGTRGYGGEVFAIVVLVVLFMVALGHSRPHGKLENVHESIPLKDAKTVDITVDMTSGEIHVAGGANPANALEADFAYRESDGKPDVDYNVSGSQGMLKVSSKDTGIHTHFGSSNNRWDLHLNDLASELQVHMGAGQGNLKLGGLNLTHVDLEMGAGQVNLDLTGDWKKNLSVNIQGGVGNAHIRLPKNVGVEASVSGGIGSVDSGGLKKHDGEYVNDAYGQSPVTVRVTVQGGVGSVDLESEK